MSHDPTTGYRFRRCTPAGDNRERHVCDDCGWIHYVNPRVVVGAVCTWEDRFLLCRRDIEPRRGFWTVPAGFMEEGESAEAATAREAREEANARLEIDALLGVYSIPRISQVQLMYRARLLDPDVAACDETSEVRLARWEEIPWDDLAFPSVTWALRHWKEVEGVRAFPPFTAPAHEVT